MDAVAAVAAEAFRRESFGCSRLFLFDLLFFEQLGNGTTSLDAAAAAATEALIRTSLGCSSLFKGGSLGASPQVADANAGM